MKKSKPKFVEHHVVYAFNGTGNHEQIDIVVPIFSTEHHLLTSLQRRGKVVSKGFLDCLRYFLWEHITTNNFIDIAKEEIKEGGEVPCE